MPPQRGSFPSQLLHIVFYLVCLLTWQLPTCISTNPLSLRPPHTLPSRLNTTYKGFSLASLLGSVSSVRWLSCILETLVLGKVPTRTHSCRSPPHLWVAPLLLREAADA